MLRSVNSAIFLELVGQFTQQDIVNDIPGDEIGREQFWLTCERSSV